MSRLQIYFGENNTINRDIAVNELMGNVKFEDNVANF